MFTNLYKIFATFLLGIASVALILPVAPAYATDTTDSFQVLNKGKKNRTRPKPPRDRGKDRTQPKPPKRDKDRTKPKPPKRDKDRTKPRPPKRDKDKDHTRPRPPRRPTPPHRRPPRRDDDWRRPPRRPVPPRRLPIPPPSRPVPPRDNGRVSQCDWDHQSVSCSLIRFRWAKPHNGFVLSYSSGVSTNRAQNLGIESLFTQGKTGKTGTAGLSRLLVEYSNGEVQDMLPTIRSLYPERVTGKGSIFLAFEGDRFDLPLRPHRYITKIYITADSWIDKYTDTYLGLTLEE